MFEEKVGARVRKGSLTIGPARHIRPLAKLGRAMTVAIVSVTVLLLLGCSAGNSDKIVFVSERDGDAEIFVMNVDGSEQTQYTENGATDTLPRWSPDKKFIAYVTNETGDIEINLVDKEGEKIQALTNTPGSDSTHFWSPDGKRIAFVTNRDGLPEVYLMDFKGSNFNRVTFGPEQPHLSGWSPDGEWLAFTLEGSSDPGIITRNPDGVNTRQLTYTGDYDAAWSPKGDRIAFTSERDGRMDIYVMGSNGSDQVALTKGNGNNYQFRWSPNGKKLRGMRLSKANPALNLRAKNRYWSLSVRPTVRFPANLWPKAKRFPAAHRLRFWKRLWLNLIRRGAGVQRGKGAMGQGRRDCPDYS